MSISTAIFDMNALKMKQKRAQKLGNVNFIDEFAINNALEIFSDIKRNFNNVAVVSSKLEFWSQGLGIKNIMLVEEKDILNFKDKKFDLIIHALSLHHCNDPIGQLIQVRQALKPDGLILAFFLGGDTLRELRTSFEEAEITIENGLSPRVAPMIEIRDAGDLLVRAGFSLSVADKTDLDVNYKSPTDLIYDLRGMGETNILVNRKKTFLKRRTFEEFLNIYKKKHKVEDNVGVKATFQLFSLAGWAPAENQQKPLKPGSATNHFSEILGTYTL